MQLRGFRGKGGGNSNRGDDNNDPTNNPIVKEALSRYGGMDEDALVEQLAVQVASAKANGTYNSAQMSAYIQMLAPHISQKQRDKLANVLKVIEAE